MRRAARRGLRGLALAALLIGCSSPSPSSPDDARPADGDAGVDAPVDGGPVGPALQLPDPDHGPFRGGTTVQLRGQGFRDSDEVWIGGRRVLDQTFTDSRRLEITTPAGEPGPADVEVRRGGNPWLKRVGAFHYDAVAVDPPGGSTAGGTFVTITGWATDFDPSTVVTFDGLPLSNVQVQNATRLTGITPPGTAGGADVLIRTAAANHLVDRAYTYFATGDPFSGGFAGDPINGSINISVIDNFTKDGIPDAFVALGDPNTTAYKGRTDALGHITFSGPDVVGPLVVTAWAADHEIGTFHCVDSQNLSIWLRSPLPPPQPGPGSIGPSGSTIKGHVLFGDAVGLGSPFWNLVPEPRTATERKRIYVTTTSPSLAGNPLPALMPIDYTFNPGQLAWPFEVSARPGATGVVAIAGLYDSARDLSGRGVEGFEPFAAGVARGVLVGPGETRDGVDVVVNIPLDAALRINLDRPPPLGTANGPIQVRLRGAVDLGGEGAVHFGRHGLIPDPGRPLAGETVFPIGTTSQTIIDLPALARAVGDGSYALQVGAYAAGGGSPFSVRLLRGLQDTGAPIVVRDFIGVPRAVDPPHQGVGTGRRVRFINDGDTTGVPTFHLHMLFDALGNPVWRGITCEGVRSIELPDLSSIGVQWPPRLQASTWVTWSIKSPAAYREFTYRWLGNAYWLSYASASFSVQFP